MCGIIGCVGVGDATDRALNGLRTLEYRGYDSAGIAAKRNGDLTVYKRAGEISELASEFADAIPSAELSIGHTRWSTHGPPTDENAHPHTSESGEVAVVHNGIISNHAELRERCRRRGYTFRSDTDTEVVAHLIEDYRASGATTDDAVRRTVAELDGTYALAVVVADRNAVYLARQGSPLVLGIGETGYYFASDVPAFLEYTDTVVYLEDGDVLRVSANAYDFLTSTDGTTDRSVETVEWDPEDAGKGSYDHYMQKEIDCQPTSLAQAIRGRIRPSVPEVRFEDFPTERFQGVTNVHLVACGTSFHAAVYARQLLNDRGLSAQAFRGCLYDGSAPVDDETLVIAVTQSGETADTLSALRIAIDAGAPTLTVTNVVGSTAARESDVTTYIRAGPEIGVAATKTFSAQVVTLSLLAEQLAEAIPGGSPRTDLSSFLTSVDRLPGHIDEMLGGTRIDELCREYYDRDAYFFIGHGLAHPVAMEGALKFKEITYHHAEGFAAGQLKHGPLALITSDVPVFTVMTGGPDEQTAINAQEAQSRGADIIAIGDDRADLGFADDVLRIPETHPDLSGLLANVQLQLVAYHSARLLDRPIDKPRNLAKSVTVS